MAFRYLGFLEGASLLLLMGVAMPLKYIYGLPEMVRVVGMAHGLLFVGYCLFAVYYGSDHNWSMKRYLSCWILACLPFGTFYFDRKVFATA